MARFFFVLSRILLASMFVMAIISPVSAQENEPETTCVEEEDLLRCTVWVNEFDNGPMFALEITEDQPGSEYRGRALPLYKIEALDQEDEKINVYLDPYSEKIVAIRSNQWRIWDFMWGIHIMDWNERDNIGNVFLKVFSILALLSALSGIYLFFSSNKKK